MPDYSKGKIYCIRSFQTDDVYIGSTTQTLAQRLGKHVDHYKQYLKFNKRYYSSFELLKYDDYYIELIKLFPCSCRAELEAEEGKYIRGWKCINKQILGRTKKQYKIDNRKLLSKKQRQYYRDNIEKIKEQRKQKITCICSCNITSINFKRHIKSKNHKKLMKLFIQNFISH